MIGKENKVNAIIPQSYLNKSVFFPVSAFNRISD